MMPSGLKPGHVLLYEGTDALGIAIDDFEEGKFCHAAAVYDDTQLCRQNPGGPALEALSIQPWASIVVKRLCLDSLVGTVGSPVMLTVGYDPHSDHKWILEFEGAWLRHKNDVYDYPGIVAAANDGILDRLGLDPLANLLKKVQDPVTAIDAHMDFCSAFVCLLLQEATQNLFGWPEFKLDPIENIKNVTPQDLSTVKLLENL